MLVPKVNSHNVYIDPLVEYTKSAINDLPNEAPADLLFTQFFLPNQFDSLINRILSSFTSMQSTRTLEEAKDDGVIDRNIQLTLDTLFKRNNVFYINDRPYTIVGNKWNKGDWELDTKPVEKLITPFAPLKGDELESAEKELNDLGSGVRMGNSAAAGIKDANINVAKTSETEKYPETIEEEEQEEVKRQFVKPDEKKLLAEITKTLDYLLGEGLTKNDPISFEQMSGKMNPSELLTFLFLIDKTQLLKFIESSPDNKSGLDVYNKYNESKLAVLDANELFFNLIMIDFGVIKKTFDDLLDLFDANIEGLNANERHRNSATPAPKTIDIGVVKNQVKNINENKNNYMKSLYNLSNALLAIFDKQQQYFVSVVALLDFIETNYRQIIGYTRVQEPTLALACIDIDRQIFSSLTATNRQNRNMIRRNGKQTTQSTQVFPTSVIYSDAYSQNIESYKQKHKEWFNTIFLNQYINGKSAPNINVSFEIEKYKKNPDLVNVEHSQYNLYMLVIMLYAFMNQGDLWRVYFGPISDFISKIQTLSQTKIQESKQKMTSYDALVQKMNGKGVLSEDEMLKNITERQTKEKEEKVKSKGKKQSMFSLKGFGASLSMSISEQEKKYIELTESEIDACETIYLYTYLLELLCLRQHCLYISDENINQIYIEISENSDKYYQYIKSCLDISDKLKTPLDLQKSIMWDVKAISSKDTIESRIKSNIKLKALYLSKKYAIGFSIDDLDKYCDKIGQLIAPIINERGLNEQCDRLLVGKGFLEIPKYVPRVQNWILNELKKYDEQNTTEFNFRVSQITRLNRKIGYKFPDNSQDWIVLRNDTDLKGIDTRFNDIYTIIKMLNAPTIDANVKKEVVDKIFQQFKICLIIFDITSETDNDEIKEGDFVSIKKQTATNELDKELDKGLDKGTKVETDNSTYKVTKVDNENVELISLGGSDTLTKAKTELFKYKLDMSVQCDNINSKTNDESKFMFFVKAKVDNESPESEVLIPSLNSASQPTSLQSSTKYELVFNHISNKLIYNSTEIPDDIIMFVYESCYKGTDKGTDKGTGKGTEKVDNILIKRAQDIITKNKENVAARDKTDNLILLEEDEDVLEEEEEEKVWFDANIELIDKILDEISGDNFKNAYNNKTLYQLLTESQSKDKEDEEEASVSAFLDGLEKHYIEMSIRAINDKFENEEGHESAYKTKKESEIKLERDKITGYNIKDKLNTKLTLETYLDVITKLKELLQDYKTKLEGLVKVNNKKIDELKEQIQIIKELLQEEGVSYEEYNVQKTKEKKVSEMTRFELDKEKETDTIILRKIEDIIKGLTDDTQRQKYTSYKQTYDNKIQEIDKARSNIVSSKKEKSSEDNEIKTNSAPITTGGKPSDDYYSYGNLNATNTYDQQPMPYGQQPMPYGPPYGQQPMPYGQQPMPYGSPYGSPYGMPYNTQGQLIDMTKYSHSNRALELTSKLAYYVSVELELYPGKTASTIQMASVKCNSTFERIREAFADLMGYQYRPAVLVESYSYQNMKPDETKNKNKKEEEKEPSPQFQEKRGGSLKNRKKYKGKNKRKNVSCKIYK
jgi:hypothetical protein